MIMTSSASPAAATAASVEETTSQPGASNPACRVMTMFCLPGSGRPIDSQVLRPITVGLPMVTALKSSLSRQGNAPPAPMTPFSEAATIIEIICAGRPAVGWAPSDGDGRLDVRMRFVVQDLEIFETVFEDARRAALDRQRR